MNYHRWMALKGFFGGDQGGSTEGGENKLAQAVEGTLVKLTAADLNGVTKVGNYGLSYSPCTEIELPETVTEIGKYAFYKSEKLEKVNIPKNITVIKEYAFANCSNLKHLDISNIKTFGKNAFYYCAMPEQVVISDGVTEIPDWCFDTCTNMKAVHIPPTVKTIGRGAFEQNLSSQFSEVHISDLSAWCRISVNTFNNEYGTPLYPSKNLYVNGELVTDLVIPDDITTIKAYAFNGLRFNSLHSNSVTTINEMGFGNSRGLVNLIIPSSVTTLGYAAFGYGKDLECVEIPESVTTIGNAAFQGCAKLAKMKMKSATPPTLGTYVFRNSDALSEIIVPTGSGEAYKSATNWSALADKIIEGDV